MTQSRVTLALGALLLTAGTAAAQAQAQQKAARQFPDGARIAIVDLQYVFASSRDGKAAASEIEALQARKRAEIAARTRTVEALQQKLTQSAALLNEEARGRLERDVARAKVDFERLVQDSEAEVQELQQQFRRAFSRKLFPAIGEIAKSRDLWAVFSATEETLLWHQPALDISEDVIVRIDEGDPAPKKD